MVVKMPRRCCDFLLQEKEVPKKKSSNGINKIDMEQGEILTDLNGKLWKLGEALGTGAFGAIYQATNIKANFLSTRNDPLSYVAKLERHSNGPLFVEVNCYLRIGKLDMIEEWKRSRDLDFLGMPHYVSSGSHYYRDEKYRFLVLPRYQKDLEQILKEKRTFNIKTVLSITIQMLHVLEYIHSKGYVHSDIKASNIMLGNNSKKPKGAMQLRPVRSNRTRAYTTRRLRTSYRKHLRPERTINYSDDIPYLDDYLELHESLDCSKKHKELTDHKYDEIYLLDYGLASKYLLPDGHHRDSSTDERRAHAGTILFCSRDAHKGVFSRRSDLESLGYNVIYWLTGELPWRNDLDEPEKVAEKKNKGFRKLNSFLKYCFNNDCPGFIHEYFEYVGGLQFQDRPNYEICRRIFFDAMEFYGFDKELTLDFNNEEDWRVSKKRRKLSRDEETIMHNNTFLKNSPLRPISSNIVFKRPKLRKKCKNLKVESMMNWSKLLIDPENILKQARDRKSGDDDVPPDLTRLDLKSMNPTYAMIDVYNKSIGKFKQRNYRILANIEGYTPAMIQIYMKMMRGKRSENKARYCTTKNNHVSYKTYKNASERRNGRHRSESPVTRSSRVI